MWKYLPGEKVFIYFATICYLASKYGINMVIIE